MDTRKRILASLLLAASAGVAHGQDGTASSDEPRWPVPAPQVVAAPAQTAPAQEGYFSRARDVIFYALSMIGIPYRWGGSTPQTGFDCSGFVQYVYRQMAGLMLPRDSYAMARVGEQVSRDDLRPGDLVFFNTLRRPFSHVGIYLGEQRFVHSPSSGGGVHIVNMNEPYWKMRYNGARRVQRP